MEFSEAQEKLSDLQATLASPGWQLTILPWIENQQRSHERAAVAPTAASESHVEARYRLAELNDLLTFIESVAENLEDRIHLDPSQTHHPTIEE